MRQQSIFVRFLLNTVWIAVPLTLGLVVAWLLGIDDWPTIVLSVTVGYAVGMMLGRLAIPTRAPIPREIAPPSFVFTERDWW